MKALEIGDRTLAIEPGRRYWHNLPAGSAEREQVFVQAALHIPGSHGWLPDKGGLMANMPVWENCVLPSAYERNRPSAADGARLFGYFESLGLVLEGGPDIVTARIDSLTAQQQRLVCVARTLFCRPALILAESEWFGRFDASSAAHVAALFAAECPDACWLTIGPQCPGAAWGAFEPDGTPA